MDRATRNLFALALVAVVLVAGVAVFVLGGGSGPDPSGERRSAVGVIVAVASDGLTDVTGFTLRQDGGELLGFRLSLENGAEFPPAHLAEHQATAAPVVVTYVDRGDALEAVRVDDWLGE